MFAKLADRLIDRAPRLYLSLIALKHPSHMGDVINTTVGAFLRSHGLGLTANDRAIQALKGRHERQRCFLIGNGPSLSAEDLTLIAGEDTFACNKITKVFDETPWRPTYYSIIDFHYIQSIHDEVFLSDNGIRTILTHTIAYRFIKKRPKSDQKAVVRMPAPLRLLLPGPMDQEGMITVDPLKRINIHMPTVMAFMIECAIYMGYKEIYLLGVDNDYSALAQGGEHFTAEYMNAQDKAYTQQALQEDMIYRYAGFTSAEAYCYHVYRAYQRYAQAHGINIVNLSRGHKLQVFPTQTLEQVMERPCP